MAEPALDRTFHVADIAQRFDVEMKTVYSWIKSEQLAALRLPGKRGGWRIRREDLDDFERRCLGQSSASPDTDSGSGDDTGRSAGPAPITGKLLPFQRGKQSAAMQKSGATNT